MHVAEEPEHASFRPYHLANNHAGHQKTIGSIIRGFKIGVTKWFHQNTNIKPVWQRNYFQHIIRNELELTRIPKYIINNPLKW